MEFIDIKESRPEVGKNVIAVGTWYGEINGLGETEYMGLGVWNGFDVDIASDTHTTSVTHVTHWMYIPKHP